MCPFYDNYYIIMSPWDEVESIKSLQNQDILLHGGKIPLELSSLF
jgi:hypothetical protein